MPTRSEKRVGKTVIPVSTALDKAKRLIAASHTRGARVKVWAFDAEPWAGIARYTASLFNRLGYRT